MTHVLISGAGIAGTTLAYWLHAHGFEVTVVERAHGLNAGGYKVDIRGAALRVAERMGIRDDIHDKRTAVRHGHVVNAAGRRVASMDGDTFGGRQADDAELLRGDLAMIVHSLTESKVDYRFADSIEAIAQSPTGVTVAFTGGDTRTFDLVVGADGLHSQTRALAFGPHDRFVQGLGHYISIFSIPNVLGLDREEITYVGPGRTALAYSTAREGEGAKAMFLFSSDPLDYDRRDLPAQQRLLADAYAGEGWQVPVLLRHMAATPDFYFDLLGQVHMQSWAQGRVALVGDAAYCASPASGQGTSLAMVGAYVLAGELATSDFVTAFAGYEQRMRPFVAANQKLGPANLKRMVLRGRGQIRVAMTMLSVLSRLPGKERMLAKAIEPIHRAANAIDLPEY